MINDRQIGLAVETLPAVPACRAGERRRNVRSYRHLDLLSDNSSAYNPVIE
jgi:hypothetical protein